MFSRTSPRRLHAGEVRERQFERAPAPTAAEQQPLVVHAREDRGTEPDGDVGEALACALIDPH